MRLLPKLIACRYVFYKTTAVAYLCRKLPRVDIYSLEHERFIFQPRHFVLK